MKRPLRTALAAACLALSATTLVAGAAFAQTADSAPKATQDTGYALVQLWADPLAAGRTKPPKGKKIDFSSTAVKSQRALLSKQRNDYKAWLRANVPGAQVTGEFDISLNAVGVKLNGATLAQVSANAMVKSAQYQSLYYPNAVDPDLKLISAEQAWAQRPGGAADAGRGVKVAIVDSGIDAEHPCFSDAGYPAQTQLGDKQYTNNKVIAARVFNMKLNQNGFDAKAVGEHGTHVAGTVACNYQTPATVNGATIDYKMSGVAPAALLGNYNVFPGDVENARSEDILKALEAAYADGFDVANMSLGGGSHGIQDLLTHAVDNLDAANMVVAISNGNDGPGGFTVGSPGMAARALTAGASTVPHFVGAKVQAGGTTVGAASGDFAVVSANLTAPLKVVTGTVNGLNNACSALPAGSLAGGIALISRGSCTFSVKIRNAQNAGALAVIVANNVAGDPTAMGTDGTANQPTAPAYMVSKDDGQALKGLGGVATTISAALAYLQTANANIMAGFSSQGPTDVDFRIKPDVVAPGVNVLSSVPVYLCDGKPCFAFLSGTSMAAPHLAGSAAVVRGQHPEWSAAEVRSAIVNTASQNVLRDYLTGNTYVTDVNIVGAGLENLLAATGATVSLDPVSLSFGGVPSGSGQSRSQSLTIGNLGSTAAGYSLQIGDATPGVSYSVSPSNVALNAGGSTTVTVTAQAAVGATGPSQAVLKVVDGSGRVVAHAMLYTLMK